MPIDVGSVLGLLLGGGGTVALIGFFANRRKNNSDVNVATFATLSQMNERLKTQLTEVQEQLDRERTARRGLEDEVARDRRERALEDRVTALEQQTPEGGPP